MDQSFATTIREGDTPITSVALPMRTNIGTVAAHLRSRRNNSHDYGYISTNNDHYISTNDNIPESEEDEV